ncbi:MAG: hypothetical protein Q7J48_12730, partial [Nocardioides sp.]|nr:hypothetical protein [Nocardioides sp.]
TLDTNVITVPNCAVAPTPTATATATATGTPTGSPTSTPTATETPTGSGTPGGPGGTGGPGESTPTPIVPVGNPDTGLAPASDGPAPVVLFVLAGLAAMGGLIAFTRAARTTRTH